MTEIEATEVAKKNGIKWIIVIPGSQEWRPAYIRTNKLNMTLATWRKKNGEMTKRSRRVRNFKLIQDNMLSCNIRKKKELT